MEHGPFDSLSSTVFYFYILISIAGPLWLAHSCNGKLQKKNPDFAGYKWGFFLGFLTLFFASAFFVQKFLSIEASIFNFGFSSGSENISIEVAYFVGFLLIGVGLIKRNRIG